MEELALAFAREVRANGEKRRGKPSGSGEGGVSEDRDTVSGLTFESVTFSLYPLKSGAVSMYQ